MPTGITLELARGSSPEEAPPGHSTPPHMGAGREREAATAPDRHPAYCRGATAINRAVLRAGSQLCFPPHPDHSLNPGPLPARAATPGWEPPSLIQVAEMLSAAFAEAQTGEKYKNPPPTRGVFEQTAKQILRRVISPGAGASPRRILREACYLLLFAEGRRWEKPLSERDARLRNLPASR